MGKEKGCGAPNEGGSKKRFNKLRTDANRGSQHSGAEEVRNLERHPEPAALARGY